jgi:TetR/AcrR family transcriptional repressor of nem operon
MTASVRHQIERFSRTAAGRTPADRRQAAIGSWAAMIGALMLARLVDDPQLSDQILSDTRRWLSAGSKE